MAAERAAGLCLPITFDPQYSDEDTINLALSVAASAYAFYVGATVDPIRRWLGGETSRGIMAGHIDAYDEMVVLAVRPPSQGCALETRCIVDLQEMFPTSCKNRAQDARGQVRSEMSFVYIVIVHPF